MSTPTAAITNTLRSDGSVIPFTATLVGSSPEALMGREREREREQSLQEQIVTESHPRGAANIAGRVAEYVKSCTAHQSRS
jgi:hypothetical protein